MKADVCRRITRGLEYVGAFFSSGGFGDRSFFHTDYKMKSFYALDCY